MTNSNKILTSTPITSFIAYTDIVPMSCCTAADYSLSITILGNSLLYLWIHRTKVTISLQSTSCKVSTPPVNMRSE